MDHDRDLYFSSSAVLCIVYYFCSACDPEHLFLTFSLYGPCSEL